MKLRCVVGHITYQNPENHDFFTTLKETKHFRFLASA